MNEMNDILNWSLAKRYLFPQNPLFKLKQISQEAFIVHQPWKNQVQFYDMQMQELQNIQFSKSMQAIQYCNIENRNFVFAGLKDGTIQGQMVGHAQNLKHKITLAIESEKGGNANINDMLYLPQGRLINCYNSGNLAFWDITKIQNKTTPISHMKNVHDDYVYKIRQVDSQTIVTCGNDTYANLIDLETLEIVNSYRHPDSIWCCYPITQNVLVSAGLLGCLMFRDIRVGKFSQVLELQFAQTSYITNLDQNHIVFGDKRNICRCDMRMIKLQRHCEDQKMKVSVESILVTPSGGIIVGRGGDMCLFLNGESQDAPEQKIFDSVNGFPQANYLQMAQNWIAHFQQQQWESDQQEGELSEEDEEQEQGDNSDDQFL